MDRHGEQFSWYMAGEESRCFSEHQLLGNWSVVKIKRRSHSPLEEEGRRGFRGYPAATIAFYGPDDTRASKVAVGILEAESSEPSALERWSDEVGDVRRNPAVGATRFSSLYRITMSRRLS